jgi:hypothetical protein
MPLLKHISLRPGLALGWALVLMVLLAPVRGRADEAAGELAYKVKAGYLFNFARFVEWPDRGTNAAATFRIGIVDDGEAFAVMSAQLAGKQVQGRTVETRHLKPGDDLRACDIVFVARSQARHLEDMRQKLGDAPVLTVGESERFAEQGGCIDFVQQGEHIRFEVNLEAAERARLKISSKIAAMATIVHAPKAKEVP